MAITLRFAIITGPYTISSIRVDHRLSETLQGVACGYSYCWTWKTQGLYSLSGKTSYHQISRSLESAWFDVIIIVSLWNLTGISAALLPRCLSNRRAIGKILTRISWLRDFTRSCGKTSVRLVNRGPGVFEHMQLDKSYPWLIYVNADVDNKLTTNIFGSYE